MAQDVAARSRAATVDDFRKVAARRPRVRPGLLPTLLLLFFATGACGLVYQQLWVRLLSFVFGVTVYAVSTVLASFFAGLALGSYVAGRLVDRARRPLQWYGIVEILVGVAALATTAALSGVERVYVGTTAFLPDSVGLLTVVRFVLSFTVLLIPATLMGASLPQVRVPQAQAEDEQADRGRGELGGVRNRGAQTAAFVARSVRARLGACYRRLVGRRDRGCWLGRRHGARRSL